MTQSQIVGAGGNNRSVPWILHGNGTLYVRQRLFTIRFSPAMRFYKPTSGVIVVNNKFWLNLYEIWIEPKGATTHHKLEAIRAKPESGARSAWDLRAEPESMAKPEKERGRSLGMGLGEPSPNFFWNLLSLVYSWKGNLAQKWGLIKILGVLTPDPQWLRLC